MTITYPLSLPTTKGIREITITPVTVVGLDNSPFTLERQVQKFPGEMWRASVTLPPMKREDAAAWQAFLLKLSGKYGTFLLGDPGGATPRGLNTGTPLIKGASQTGNSITIDGLPNSTNGIYLKGDYVQFGSGATASLHMVLDDVNSNGSGEATLLIWPSVRTSPVDNAAVVTTNTVGRFALASNLNPWSLAVNLTYGIQFDAWEAF